MPTGYPNGDVALRTLIEMVDKETLQRAVLKLLVSKNGTGRKYKRRKKRQTGEAALKKNTK